MGKYKSDYQKAKEARRMIARLKQIEQDREVAPKATLRQQAYLVDAAKTAGITGPDLTTFCQRFAAWFAKDQITGPADLTKTEISQAIAAALELGNQTKG